MGFGVFVDEDDLVVQRALEQKRAREAQEKVPAIEEARDSNTDGNNDGDTMGSPKKGGGDQTEESAGNESPGTPSAARLPSETNTGDSGDSDNDESVASSDKKPRAMNTRNSGQKLRQDGRC